MDTPPAPAPEAEAENALAATASLAIAPLLIDGSDSASAPLLPPPFHGFTSIFDANYSMQQDWIEKMVAVGWIGR